MAQYLQHAITGVIFPYTEALAKHPDMRHYEPPRAGEVEAPAPKAAAAVSAPVEASDAATINVASMTKAQVLEYAEAQFGVDLDPSKKVGELRDELAQLAAAQTPGQE